MLLVVERVHEMVFRYEDLRLRLLEYKTRLAIYYLTEAMDMGYCDGSVELMKGHATLSKLYSDLGGEEMNSKFALKKVENEA